ncbi:MAG: ATP-dependent helicase [Candidatus Doudnabacteria bacterium]|nr:ATP-dependent helicase [Candidatus Doudnabacteria bacterium]
MAQILKGINKEQEEAVTFGNGPLLIIAGAGTGKTTVITRRIAYLLEQKLAKPDEILALTFTEKAATEMEERVDLLTPLGYVDINISTFHSFAQRILQQHPLDIGLPGDFKVITETEAWILVKKHLHEFDLDYYKPIGNPNKFIHTLLKHFNKAKGEEISPEDYLKYAENLRLKFDSAEIKKKAKSKKKKTAASEEDENEAARINEVANAYYKYQKLLLDNSYLDFGDLINYALKLFRTRPKILTHYQKKYRYILVDEFQDTDLSQYELVKLLAKPENNITVVGDDDQSIYKFRGASVSNILKFKEDYPSSAEVALTENYRSSQEILDLAYNFIQLNNPERLESKLKISKKLVANKERVAGEIKVLHAQNLPEEASLVANKIEELKSKQDVTYNDFAILVRANDHAEPFLVELNRLNIPYIYVANRGLYRKPFILDVLSYLRIVDNHFENADVYRVLTMPKFQLEHNDLVQVTQTAKRKAHNIIEVLKDPALVAVSQESRKKISELLARLEKHSRLSLAAPVSEFFVRVVTDLGLVDSLKQDSAANQENRNLLEQIYKKTLEFESESKSKTVKSFLNQIDLEQEAGEQGMLSFNPELGPEAVKVMTVHSAKGLEFDTVFLVNMVDQRFPTRERRDAIEIPETLIREILPEGDAHLMEERRLFYVAITRAKRHLYLTWANDYGGVSTKKPSQFLVEAKLEQTPAKPAPVGKVFFSDKSKATDNLKPIAFNLPVPDTFSYSQIASFLFSPLEYKYKYLYHLPMPGEAQLSFGITIHKTLEKFLLATQQANQTEQSDLFGKSPGKIIIPDKKVLFKLYEDSWVDDWFEDSIQKENYRKLGAKMLDNFYERYKEDPKPIKFLEKKFKLKLGDYKFTGKIDRADLNNNGSISIVDYKTGQVKEKLSSDDKTQLLIYQWAAQEEFKEKVDSLKYWYLASLRDTESFVGSESDIEKVKAKILSVIEQIVEAIKHDSFAELDKNKLGKQKFRDLER